MTFFNNKVCPRCGRQYEYIEERKQGERVYFYAVHVEKLPGGKRRVKRCYLGPLVYSYVSKLHRKEGLVFKGLLEVNRAIEYLESILQSLLNGSADRETRREIARKLRFYADLLDRT